MDVLKVTSKGQVTLPASVRKALGIDDQTYLIAERIGDYLVLRKLEERLDELTALFETAARERGITRDELVHALREGRGRAEPA